MIKENTFLTFQKVKYEIPRIVLSSQIFVLDDKNLQLASHI